MQTVRLFLTDVDGCMTDGGMYYTEDGKQLKRFCVYDGVGIKNLQARGIKCGIITGENTPIVANRAKDLGVDYLYMGVGSFHRDQKTKLEVAQEICHDMDIDLSEVVYLGDDENDIDLLEKVGYAFCPPNAAGKVKEIHGIYVTDNRGGDGAVREVSEWILSGWGDFPGR